MEAHFLRTCSLTSLEAMYLQNQPDREMRRGLPVHKRGDVPCLATKKQVESVLPAPC